MKWCTLALALLLAAVCVAESSSGGSSSSTSSGNPLHFNEAAALQALMYSWSAYCPMSSIEDWSCKWCTQHGAAGFTPTAFFNDAATNTFGYAGMQNNTNTIVLAFRGTQLKSISNWISDLSSLVQVSYPLSPNAQVAEGFLNAYQVVQSQVRTAVRDLMASTENPNFIFTGHSLGAAISVLAALDIIHEFNIPTPTLINFGCPRIGDINFFHYAESMLPRDVVTRVVWIDDIVPHLPPMSGLEEYHHIATEVWAPNTSSFKTCNGSGEDPSCSDSVPVYDFSVTQHFEYFNTYNDGSGHSGC